MKVIRLLIFFDSHEFRFSWPPIQKKESPSAHVDPKESVPYYEDTTRFAAMRYLKNSTWHKDSLDKYPHLNGLYDDLNEFKFDELSEVWKNKLDSIPVFTKVIDRYK